MKILQHYYPVKKEILKTTYSTIVINLRGSFITRTNNFKYGYCTIKSELLNTKFSKDLIKIKELKSNIFSESEIHYIHTELKQNIQKL